MLGSRVIRALCPPILWNALRSLAGRSDPPPTGNYQGVITPEIMPRLHQGRFAEIHEKWAALDTHIGRDTNKTRLRVYSLCSFASLALANTRAGDFLTAGISFGTAPLIMAEYLDTGTRTFHLVDPLSGSKVAGTAEQREPESAYNTDFNLVAGRWSEGAPVNWIREYLTPDSVADIGPLAFVHLNTGDLASELSALPSLYAKLLPGGFIVMDLYGWQGEADQRRIDDLLAGLGAQSFALVTRQLVIFKPG